MQKIKNIIFDYGNVIFSIDFQRTEKSFEKLGLQDPNSVFSHKSQHQLFDRLDRGEISAAQFREEVRNLIGNQGLTDEEIDGAWNSLLIGVPQIHHDILMGLKAHYRTFLLSNNNEIHYSWILEYLQRNYGLADNAVFFEKAYYSHLMGMRKPDREIFEFVLNAHGLIPAETLFVDDSPQHIATAAKLGLQVKLVSPNENLATVVKELQLVY